MALKEEKRRGRPPLKNPKVRVTMLMPPGLKVELEDWAEERGIGYQTLAQEILADAAAAHEVRAGNDARKRIAGIGYEVRQLLDQLAELTPEDAQGVRAEEVAHHLRAAHVTLKKVLRESSGGVVSVSAEQVREKRRRILERASKDPDAPLVDE